MSDMNLVREWLSEQSELELLRLSLRGRRDRQNGSWGNWSHWSQLMWVLNEENRS